MAGFVWRYPAVVVRVVDADTLKLRLDLGYSLFTERNCRIIGVNAPELYTRDGRAAREWVAERVPAGTAGEFASHQLDKYGRPLGDLSTPALASLRDALLAAGHAVRYPS